MSAQAFPGSFPINRRKAQPVDMAAVHAEAKAIAAELPSPKATLTKDVHPVTVTIGNATYPGAAYRFPDTAAPHDDKWYVVIAVGTYGLPSANRRPAPVYRFGDANKHGEHLPIPAMMEFDRWGQVGGRLTARLKEATSAVYSAVFRGHLVTRPEMDCGIVSLL